MNRIFLNTPISNTTVGATTTYTAAGAALNAGFSALAAQASVSLSNNGGDIGKTLKDLGSSNTVKNTLVAMATANESLNQNGKGAASNVNVNYYGGAANAADSSKTLQQLTGNEKATVNSTVHPQDFIGTVVGGNPATTTGAANDGRGVIGNAVNVLLGTDTPHNSYGSGNQGKEDLSRVYWPEQTPNTAPKNLPDNPSGPAKGPTSVFNAAQDSQQKLQEQVGTTPLPVPGDVNIPSPPSLPPSKQSQQIQNLKQQLLKGQ